MKLIYESALPPRLKATAAMLVFTFGRDGREIRPSIERAGWTMTKDPRQMRNDVRDLSDRGVLVPRGKRRKSGRDPVIYDFDITALPVRPPFESNAVTSRRRDLSGNNAEEIGELSGNNTEEIGDLSGNNAEEIGDLVGRNAEVLGNQPGIAPSATRKFSVTNPVENCRLSSNGSSDLDPLTIRTASPKAAGTESEASAGSDKARLPNGDNADVIAALVHSVLDEQPELEPFDRACDLVEEVKTRCARDHRLDYGRHPDVSPFVVQRAVDRVQRVRMLRKTGQRIGAVG
ncbi:MAG: hypothetical protein AB7L71_07775 [Vicinamibacterales bacterium]